MQHIRLRLATFSLWSFISFAFAGEMGTSSGAMNQDGLFLGVGGSYNHVQINTNLSGELNATLGFTPLGYFSSKTQSFSNAQGSFAPEAQMGYFRHFEGSNTLWGIEFLYQYSRIQITAHGENLDPGSFVELKNQSMSVVDLVTIDKVQTKVSNELMLPVFIGQSFAKGFLYLGGGPALFQIQYDVGHITDNASAFYIGQSTGFSNSKWLWGGLVQAGVAYYLNPTWFLKLNYTYSATGRTQINHVNSFGPSVNHGLNTGTLAFNTSKDFMAQEVALSINKVFSF